MEQLFIDTYNKRNITIISGKGSYLFDNKKHKYLDFLSGISINNWGYNNTQIRNAIKIQLNKIIHPSNYYWTEPQISLAQKLVKMSGLDRVFFANSGTEANEAALMFLEKYRKINKPNKTEVIIFKGSFLGRTYGSRKAVSGSRVENLSFKIVAFNDLACLRKAFSSKTLCIHLELVLGHGGIKAINEEVIEEVEKLAIKYDVLIFVDEVQIGLGRIAKPFAFKLHNLKPDIVTIGKSLGGGLPLSATIVKKKISQSIKPGDYGSTMGGNSLACAAGNIILDLLSDQKNLQMIRKKSQYLKNKLNDLKEKYLLIDDVRVYGLMAGIEIKISGTDLVRACIRKGLLIDCVNNRVLRILPPFTISYKEIDLAISILSNVLKEYSHE